MRDLFIGETMTLEEIFLERLRKLPPEAVEVAFFHFFGALNQLSGRIQPRKLSGQNAVLEKVLARSLAFAEITWLADRTRTLFHYADIGIKDAQNMRLTLSRQSAHWNKRQKSNRRFARAPRARGDREVTVRAKSTPKAFGAKFPRPSAHHD